MPENPLAQIADDKLLALANGEPLQPESPFAAVPDDDLLAAANAGTAESYVNLAKRGALPEGLWMGGQGMAELPRTVVALAGFGAQKFAELSGDQQALEAILRKRAALADPASETAREIANVPEIKVADWMTDAFQTARDRYRKEHPVRPDVQESLSGQIVQGLGQAVPMTAQALTAPQTILPMAVGQIHQEGLDDARSKGATDEQARLTAAAYLPAAGLESISELKLVRRLLEPLAGKVTIRHAIKQVLGQVATEGSTEAAQQLWLNAVEKAGFKPDQELTDQVLDSFLVGGAVGGMTTGGGIAVGEGSRRVAEHYSRQEAEALARWARALQPQAEPETTNPVAADGPAPDPRAAQAAQATTALQAAIAENDAKNLPQGVVENQTTRPPAEEGQTSAGTVATPNLENELAAELAQVEAQRAEAAVTQRRAALQQRSLQELVGAALAPRVAEIAGKTELEQHDFWRGMQGLAATLAQLQTMTPDGKQARSRQLDLGDLREQAGMIFQGASPEMIDAIALKLHGSKPAESVAALRDFYRYAGQQRQPFAAAAMQREKAEQEKRIAAMQVEIRRQEEAKIARRREAKERAAIRDTGRDLEGRVSDWTAVPDAELERLAAEPENTAQSEIDGARNELERRMREEGGQQPLTREEQIRLIERYGGINPDHPVHKGEIASLRESELGRNRKLWREDGNSLDTLAEQIRQDVQNGPQTEADVLEWIGELAAGRTPKIYERGDLAADYARALPPATRFSVQRPQEHPLAPGRTIPGFNQVDFFEGDRNTRSATLDELRAEDYEVPEIPDAMPTGQYSEDQVRGRARWARRMPEFRVYRSGDPANEDAPPKGTWMLNDGRSEQTLASRGTSAAGVRAIIAGVIQRQYRLPEGSYRWQMEDAGGPTAPAPHVNEWSGMTVAPLSSEAAREIGLEPEERDEMLGLYDNTTGDALTTLRHGFSQEELLEAIADLDQAGMTMGLSREGILARVQSRNEPPPYGKPIMAERAATDAPRGTSQDEIERIVRTRTGFSTFAELVNAPGNYRPTINLTRNGSPDIEMERLAEAYDQYQNLRGDPRRAHRIGAARQQAAPAGSRADYYIDYVPSGGVALFDMDGEVLQRLSPAAAMEEARAIMREALEDEEYTDAQLTAMIEDRRRPATPATPAGWASVGPASAGRPGFGLRAPKETLTQGDLDRQLHVGKVLERVAKRPEAWRHPGKPTGKTLDKIAAWYSTDRTKLTVKQGSYPGQWQIDIDRGDGKPGDISVTESDGEVSVSASSANSNKQADGGGAEVYQAIFSWAAANGYKVFGSSLSPVNQFRRTINMLSSALRHGSTAHMEPNYAQGVRGWSEHDTTVNIGALAEAASRMAQQRAPELDRLTYDLRTDTVVDHTDGRRLSTSDLERFVAENRLGAKFGIGAGTARLLLASRAAMAAGARGDRALPAKTHAVAAEGGLRRIFYGRRNEGATGSRAAGGIEAAPARVVRQRLDKLERRFRRMFPALFADIDVRIADVREALAREGYETPEGVEAAYLPRLHAERDLIVLGLDAALRNDGRTGLARLLHESGHAYWRMLSPETREALRTLYERDLQEQWSPLWKDGELATEVSQEDILAGDELGLEEWFSELMAAVNNQWATRRYEHDRVPGWLLDLAAKLRALLQGLWRRTADHKGLTGAERTRYLNDDFRGFLTRGFSAQRTAAAGAAFAQEQRPIAHVRTETDIRSGDTRQQYAIVTRNTIPGEKPWRVTYFDRNRQPYYHDDYATEAQAKQVAADFGVADPNVRFAQPQKIVEPKAIDVTATGEDTATATKWIGIMPAFQGGKYQMANPAAALIRQKFSQEDRAKITAITDYFGGGMWGSYLALTHFPNVQRIVVNEFDPLRAAKIRLLHEAPERLAEMVASQANQALLQAVVAEANTDTATSGSAFAARLRQLRAKFGESDPGLSGLLIDATMSARGRAVDEQGNKTAEATYDKVIAIALRDAADAAKGAAALRERGIRVEVVQGDAYARPIEQGAHVLAVFDPPYYLTTGYNGKRVPLGIYERTADTIRELAANANAILYTDSAWWLDTAEKAEKTPDIFTGEMADRAALSRIVDSLDAVGIVPVEKRHEIIGINRPGETHDARPARGAHRDSAGAGRDGSAGQGEGDRTGSRDDGSDRRGELAGGAAPAARPVPSVTQAREAFDAADQHVRELETKIKALADGESQDDDVEAQGAALQRELTAARRERAKRYAEATTARAIVVDPIDQALAKDPTVRALRDQKIKLGEEFDAAKKDGRPTEEILDRRDKLDADLEAIRRKAEQGTFPLSYDQPTTWGDVNPPRNDTPPKTGQGAPDPEHLRPIRITSWEPFTDPQLTERLERLRRLRDAIGGDDLEAGSRLSFLADLVRDTREELEARRAALEQQVERDAIGEAKTAPESQAAHEDEELAREQERAAQATLATEAATAIPDAAEEAYPIRQGVEEIGAQVSASTLEGKSGLRNWLEKVGELLRGFRSAVPELPTFKDATQYATFREGLRLMHGLDETVRHDAEEAIADIVAPLQQHSTVEARSKQARLQELRRGLADVKTEPAKAKRMESIRAIEQELATDPWYIFQNVVLYGDLFTRSRLYHRDDGSPIGLPGGLNPAEAEHLFKQWLTRAHQHPQKEAILEARTRHKAYVARIAADLQARGFVFSEGANTNYFPHVMLDHWNGDIAHVKAGTASDFRSYLITPTGSTKAIETDYLKAMYYHAVQVLAHNRRADILRDYVARENIKAQLQQEAREARRRDPDAPPVTWQQIFHTQYKDTHDIYAPDPDEIPLHPELVLDRDALSKRLGIVLGSGPLQQELKKHGLTNIPLQPGEIQEMLVAGSKELWVLPKPVAEALRGVSRRAKKTDNLVTKILGTANGLWKRNILFAPWNWLRFEFNNLVSDGEKLLVSDPAMAKGLIAAGRDVYAFLTGEENASADVREAFRLGVLDTLTAAEVQALRAQRPFEAWETAGDRAKRTTVNRLTSFFGSSRWNTMGWSKLREATFRFAKYKADLERMRNGATPQYGGAYWKNIEALQRVGAPENITTQDRLGRGMGRQGPGSGAIVSATPYVLQWEESGRRHEEAFASPQGRATKRAELEARQKRADTDLLARKAAAISRATFGDYGELTPNGNGIRRLLVPFFAWTEVNFRYHANLFRNMRDQLRSGQIDRSTATTQMAKQAAVLGGRAALGMALRLALPYLAVSIWNAAMYGDDEDDLSEEDRRRFHLLLGRDENGKISVVYLPTAFSDLAKWFSGNRAAALVGDVTTGRTDWQTAAGQFAEHLVPDFLNNTLGSIGPIGKVIYTAASQKSTFPDVTDQRTIPSYDLRRVILGQMSDQVVAEAIELAVNRDYVASRDLGEWAQQTILQVRRRDPESWAFYAIKDKASAYEERMTGKREGRAAYDAPDAQVLRQFRRAIYQADVPTATRMYQRLLELGYTAERFESSVRAQDPLYGLPKAMRDGFVASLNADERAQLRNAYLYYQRMQELEGAGRRLFPSREASERTRARYQANPRLDVLHREIQQAITNRDDEEKAARMERKALR